MKYRAGIIPTIDKDKVVIVGQNEKKSEIVKWQIKNPHKGHKLFQIDLTTGDITEAEYKKVDVQLKKLGSSANLQNVSKKVIAKKNCIYISALNIQNAAKKFAKQAKAGGLIK